MNKTQTVVLSALALSGIAVEIQYRRLRAKAARRELLKKNAKEAFAQVLAMDFLGVAGEQREQALIDAKIANMEWHLLD